MTYGPEGGDLMKAVVIAPGKRDSDRLVELPDPVPAEGELLVQVLSVGVDGTDDELVAGEYGEAPAGRSSWSSATSPWAGSANRPGGWLPDSWWR
jgi:NADPH:quinone reductase-like Zn-dependent oxidoreductase